MTAVLAEDKALIVREGNLDRHRVPSSILTALGASFDTGDGIAWQVQDFGAQGKLVVGTLVKGARRLEEFKRMPPTAPQRTAAQPAGAKKSAKKGGAAAPLAPPLPPPPGMGSAFAVPVAAAPVEEDDDYLDDGPLPPAPVPAPAVPVARPLAPVPAAAAPAPVPAKGGAKKSAKKGAVAYQIPGSGGGLGSAFSE